MAKYTVLSVTKRDGIGKETGRPYTIPRVLVISPFRESSTDKWTLSGVGFTPVELVVSESFYPKFEAKFKSDFKGQPLTYDFEVSLDHEGKNVLVDFEAANDLSKKFGA